MAGFEEMGGSQVGHMVLLIEGRDVGEIGRNVEELEGRVLIPGSVLCFELGWCLGS